MTEKLSFELIEATTTDYEFLNNLGNDDYYKYAKSREVFHDETGQSSVYSFMVFTDDHKFLGYVKGFYPVHNNSLWIQTLLVNKTYKRLGYGSAIVYSFVQKITEQGKISKLFLTCHQDNIAGIEFWQNLGFKRALTNIKNTNDLYEASTRSILCNPKFTKH